MRALRTFGLVFVLIVLPSCAAWLIPETPRERLVAAEADYETAVRTIGDLTDRGLIRGQAAQAAADAIVAGRSALDFWHDLPDDPDRLDAAIAALTALQALVRSMERGVPT